MRQIVTIVVLAISLMSATRQACAQIRQPEPINTPLQAEWRGPFEQFLGELGARNARAIVEKTNAFQIGGIWHPDSILFRVEDPTLCSEDMCFTVVGRIANNKSLADAMFAAGKRFTRGDHYIPLFGFQTIHAWLVGDKVTVTLLETPKGWIVAVGPNMATPP
jgi:hypothetical protein